MHTATWTGRYERRGYLSFRVYRCSCGFEGLGPAVRAHARAANNRFLPHIVASPRRR